MSLLKQYRPPTGKRIVVVFSGFNERAIIAFLRSATGLGVFPAIVAVSRDDRIFQTVYSDLVLAVRNSVPLDVEDMLDSLETVKEKTGADELLIAPSTEALNRFLLQNREAFEGHGAIIPIVEQKLYEKLSDKLDFKELCRFHGLPVPAEYNGIDDVRIPFVAKPKCYRSKFSKGTLSPILVENDKAYQDFLNGYSPEDYFYQKFISGRSIYLLYYFTRNREVYRFSQENLMQQPDGKSIVAAVSSRFHRHPISSQYEAMLLSMGFHGFLMVELRFDGKTFYMIEANPRFWGPSQLFVDAGMDFFSLFLHEYGLCERIRFEQEGARNCFYYYWGGGESDLIASNSLVYYGEAAVDGEAVRKNLTECDLYKRNDTCLLNSNNTNSNR